LLLFRIGFCESGAVAIDGAVTLKHQTGVIGVDQAAASVTINKDQKQPPILVAGRFVVWGNPVLKKSVAAFRIGDDFRAGRDRLKSLPGFQVFHCWLLVKKEAPSIIATGGAVVL
jgi:hypothetical protein